MNPHSENVHKTVGISQMAKREGGARLDGTKRTYIHSIPRITIITSTLNAAKSLPKIIESIRDQRYDNFEWLIIDGGSKDGTLEILQQNESVIDYWLSEPDRGIYDAWNKGLRFAEGDWLLFLGADDHLADRTVLAKAAEQLRAAPSRHLVAYGDVLIVDDEGKLIERSGAPWDRDRFTQCGMTFSHQGVFHHRSLFSQLGPFDDSYRIAGDYEWLLRAISTTEPFYLKGLTVAAMQTGGLSANDANGLQVLREYARAQRRHLGRLVPWGLGWTAAKAVTKIVMLGVVGQRGTHRLIDAYRAFTGRPPRWKNACHPDKRAREE